MRELMQRRKNLAIRGSSSRAGITKDDGMGMGIFFVSRAGCFSGCTRSITVGLRHVNWDNWRI